MRRFILFCIFLLVFSGFQAQLSFNRAYHSASEKAVSSALVINGSYYHFVQVSDYSTEGNQGFVYKHAGSSVLKFRKPIIQNVKLNLNQAFVTRDNQLMVLCNDFYCGPLSGIAVNSYLVKLDTNGNQVFKTAVNRQFSVPPPGGGDVYLQIIDRFKQGFQNVDSTFVVFSDSVMFKFSSQGVFLSRKNLGMDSVTAVLLLANNNILINGHVGNSHSLLVLSPTGNTLSVTPFPRTIKKLMFYGGNKIVGLNSSGNLEKISGNCGAISTTNFALNTGVTDFICVLDTVYTCRRGPNSTSLFFACDTSFNSVFNSAITTKSFTPVAITKYRQKIILSATSTSDNQNNLYQNYFSSISVFDRSVTPQHNFNVELSKVRVDTAYYAVNYTTGYGSGFELFLRLKFYIKNKGTGTLNTFKLTSGIDPYSASCGLSSFYQQAYTGLTILPGDSSQFTSGLISRYVFLDNSGYSYPGVPQQHCVFLTLPNGEVDMDQSNNEMCVFENFHNLGVKANLLLLAQVMVYPNPVQGVLKIESPFDMKSVQIYDFLGRKVQEIKADYRTVEIDTQDLPEGIYVVGIETEEGFVTKKIIKE